MGFSFRMYQLTLNKQSSFLPPNTKQHNEALRQHNIALKRADRLPTKSNKPKSDNRQPQQLTATFITTKQTEQLKTKDRLS